MMSNGFSIAKIIRRGCWLLVAGLTGQVVIRPVPYDAAWAAI